MNIRKIFNVMSIATICIVSTSLSAIENDIERLAQQGDARAQLALAADLIKSGMSMKSPQNSGGIGENAQDSDAKIAEGIEWLKKSAEQNCGPAQNWLGVIYGEGKFLKRDMSLAVKWRELAASNGSPIDKWALGNAFLLGYFLPKDLQKGIFWIEKSAEEGYPEAIQKSAEIRKKLGDTKGEQYWTNKLANIDLEKAKSGNSAAMFACSKRFLKGTDGFQKNMAQGIYWLKASAEAGYMEAVEKLASYYISGRYVSKDFGQAIALYENLAKEEPSFYAQLATLYDTGKNGFPIDKLKARSYLEKYAQLGNPVSTSSTRGYLAWLYWREANTEKALYWCEQYMETLPVKSLEKRAGTAEVAHKIADSQSAPEKFSDFMGMLSGAK